MNADIIRMQFGNWIDSKIDEKDFLEKNFEFLEVRGILSGTFKGEAIVGTLVRPTTFTAYPLIELRKKDFNLIIPYEYMNTQREFINMGEFDGRLAYANYWYKYIKNGLTKSHHQSDDAVFISENLFKKEVEGKKIKYKVKEVKEILENLKTEIISSAIYIEPVEGT